MEGWILVNTMVVGKLGENFMGSSFAKDYVTAVNFINLSSQLIVNLEVTGG